MTDSIPLAVVVPIIGGVVSLLVGLRREKSGWAVSVVTVLAEAVLVVDILTSVASASGRRVTYHVGGFAPPAGIELVADGFSASVVALVSAVALGFLAYSRESDRGNAFYTAFLVLVGGLSGFVLTGDLFNMYVFLEITGLTAYALVASGDSPRSAVASLKYLVVGTVGASLFLLGVGYLYIATGTLNMVDLSERIADFGYSSRLVVSGFGLILTGLLVKAAIFPLHTWQPDAYAESPDSVSALISALVSTAAVYGLARVIYTVFTVDFFEAVPVARDVVLYLASVSIVAGSVLAVLQTDIKRMLAYSSVSQYGLIVAGFVMGTKQAAVGGLIYLLGHAVLKGGAFAAAGAVAAETGDRKVDEYAGLFGRSRVTAVGLGVIAMGLIGVPPGPGFVGKWYIVVGAVETGSWVVAGVILVSTVLSLAYLARIVERVFFAGRDTTDAPTGAAADGGSPGGASTGMVAVVVTAAVVGMALGPMGTVVESFADPVLTEVFG
ncbi:proton-conducting transporter membrane subunit [Halorutilales archaeon Cl-col2-1]